MLLTGVVVDDKTGEGVIALALEPNEQDAATQFSVCDERIKSRNCSKSYLQF